MTAAATLGDRLAVEAERYLAVIEQFAALEADPHAQARAHAARARAREQPSRRRPSLRRRHDQ